MKKCVFRCLANLTGVPLSVITAHFPHEAKHGVDAELIPKVASHVGLRLMEVAVSEVDIEDRTWLGVIEVPRGYHAISYDHRVGKLFDASNTLGLKGLPEDHDVTTLEFDTLFIVVNR